MDKYIWKNDVQLYMEVFNSLTAKSHAQGWWHESQGTYSIRLLALLQTLEYKYLWDSNGDMMIKN